MLAERVWNLPLKGWCACSGELGKESNKYSAQVYENWFLIRCLQYANLCRNHNELHVLVLCGALNSLILHFYLLSRIYIYIYIDASSYVWDMQIIIGKLASSACLSWIMLWIEWYFTSAWFSHKRQGAMPYVLHTSYHYGMYVSHSKCIIYHWMSKFLIWIFLK